MEMEKEETEKMKFISAVAIQSKLPTLSDHLNIETTGTRTRKKSLCLAEADLG
jgi:hypothetical protein